MVYPSSKPRLIRLGLEDHNGKDAYKNPKSD
jgi:hypothetical protein